MPFNITQDDALFRPVTIRLETQDDYDKFYAIVAAVADDKLVRTPQVIEAAKQLRAVLNSID